MSVDNICKMFYFKKKTNYLSLFLGIISISIFFIAHLLNISILVYIGAFLVAFNFIVFSEDLLCIELLYIPVVSIVKSSPEGSSFVSYISLIGIIVFLLKKKDVKFDKSILFFFFGFVLFIFLKEILQKFNVSMVYFRSILTMCSSFLFLKSYNKDGQNTFFYVKKSCLYLSIGVLISSLIGYFFSNNVNLVRFFGVDYKYINGEIVSRFCGVSADPNYYSSLVIFAISVNLFLFLHSKKYIYLIFVSFLTFFGLLSLSKMFLLLLLLLLLIFIILLIRNRGSKGFLSFEKIIFLIFAIVIFVYLLNTPSVKMIFERMENSNGLNDLTTGRFDTWIQYLDTIFSNINYFLFGTDNNSMIVGTHLTHNTFLQIWWKLGLIGLLFVLGWCALVWNEKKYKSASGTIILLIGCFGSALAIDLFFFEQLFWFYIFSVLSISVIDAKSRGGLVE